MDDAFSIDNEGGPPGNAGGIVGITSLELDAVSLCNTVIDIRGQCRVYRPGPAIISACVASGIMVDGDSLRFGLPWGNEMGFAIPYALR